LSRYIDDDRLPAEVFETDINLGIMIDQQHRRALSKCFKLPDTSALADLVVPEPEAGKVLFWVSSDELGNRDITDFGTSVVLPLPIANGGTGAETPEEALDALGAEPADADILKRNVAAILTKGFPAAPTAMDTSGPTPATGALQTIDTSGGAVALAAPSQAGVIRFIVTGNNALTPSASYQSVNGVYDAGVGLAQGEIVSDGENHFLTVVNGVGV
jgi:hypothetical protein